MTGPRLLIYVEADLVQADALLATIIEKAKQARDGVEHMLHQIHTGYSGIGIDTREDATNDIESVIALAEAAVARVDSAARADIETAS